jgi:hypothetical protein
LDWFRGCVVIGDEIQDILSQISQSFEMIWLQKLSLQNTEPYLDLVQPRCVGRQPVDLDVQCPAIDLDLFPQPAFKLLGCVCRAIIQNQGQSMNTACQSFRDHRPQQESLEVYKPLPQATCPIDFSIGHTQSGKEIQCPLALVPVRDVCRMTRHCRIGLLRSLARLDRGLFVHANNPNSLPQQRFRLPVEPQDGTGAFQKGLRVQNVLPTMVAPRPDLFRCQPPTYRASRDAHHHSQCCQSPCDLRVAPPRKGHTLLSWSAAGQRRRLRFHLRGKNAEEHPAVASPQCFSSLTSAVAISEQSGAYTQLPRLPADCSTLDGHRQPGESEPELPSRGTLCENSPAFAVPVPLQLLTRWHTWALVRAFFTSWPKYTALQSSRLGAYLRIAVLSTAFR